MGNLKLTKFFKFLRNWFTALDVQDFGSLLASGDNKGNVNLLTTDGEMVWKKKLHNDKIHHVEFHSQYIFS